MQILKSLLKGSSIALLAILAVQLIADTAYADHLPREVQPTYIQWGDPDHPHSRPRDPQEIPMLRDSDSSAISKVSVQVFSSCFVGSKSALMVVPRAAREEQVPSRGRGSSCGR